MIGTPNQLIRWLLDKPQDKTYEVKQKRKKRSLDQNGLYWALVTEIANVMRLSKNEVHNIMLRRYGQPAAIEGRLVTVTIPDTDKAAKETLLEEYYHVKPTSQVKLGTKNTLFRTYILLRGSSTYDSREMSILIDGVIDEAQAIGIETEQWTALLKPQKGATSADAQQGWRSTTQCTAQQTEE